MSPRRPTRTRRRWLRPAVYLIPLLAALSVCLPKLNQGEFSVDTGWYSAIALQAFRAAAAGDADALWSLPGVGGPPPDGVPYFNKPPLGFWLGGLPLWTFGPELWAARLGSVVAAGACVLATVQLARLSGTRSTALAAGLVLALTPAVVAASHSFSLDLWLTFFLIVALWSVVRARATGRGRALVFAGVPLGLALLVKPLLALVAVPIVAIWLLWIGRARWIGWTLVAGAVAIAVALPWHLSMARQHGRAFTDQYLGREIADRAAGVPGGATVPNRDAASPLYYAEPILETYWPWLVPLAGAAIMLGSRRAGRCRDWLKLGVVWTVVWLVALSAFPDKRPRYLLPLYPVWAWTSAMWLTAGAPPAWRRLWAVFATRVAPAGLPLAGLAVALLPLRMHRAEGEQWQRLYVWIESNPGARLYQGGFVGQRAARLYLRSGRWPTPLADLSGVRLRDPERGSFILYHNRDGLAPGPNEREVFREERLLVTRFEGGTWQPTPASDPGE